ncbi:MAG TPA: hypothetical protein VFT22_15230, partial [Kofleriaceae bacterium]|nr:hypothetical protein [Kofleriaceae bacterium]
MRSSAVLLGLVTSGWALLGCGFQAVPAEPPGVAGGGGDQPPAPGDQPPGEAGPPGADACATFSSQLDTCVLPLGGDLILTGTLAYDTEHHTLTDAQGATITVVHQVIAGRAGEVEAILARDVHLSAGSRLHAIGPLPLAIIAGGSVTLDPGAAIDVDSGGAGAQATCASGPAAGQSDAGGAAGGGGGGYGADGGDGGDGNSDGLGPDSRGGTRGRAIAAMPAGPRGGCPGAGGGRGDDAGGAGGPGGGAIDVVAAARIELGDRAAITAGGGGGGGGSRIGGSDGDAGGGGGGSGGMILLEAPHVSGPQGILAANGGGGGEGSGNGAAGQPGSAGAAATTRATGGTGSSPTGADGGHGGSVELVTGEKPATVQ